MSEVALHALEAMIAFEVPSAYAKPYVVFRLLAGGTPTYNRQLHKQQWAVMQLPLQGLKRVIICFCCHSCP